MRRNLVSDLLVDHFNPSLFAPDYDYEAALWRGLGKWQPGQALHHFVDDYRHEVCFRRPEDGLARALISPFVIAPDYTVYTDDPEPLAAYNVWRSAVVASFWAAHGVHVVPSVSFHPSFSTYVQPGSVVAVRAPRSADRDSWTVDLLDAVSAVSPSRILVFGRAFDLQIRFPFTFIPLLRTS